MEKLDKNQMEKDLSWISKAFQEADNNSAIQSARDVARLEKCGCRQCLGIIAQIYASWYKWGRFSPSTRQNTCRSLQVVKK